MGGRVYDRIMEKVGHMPFLEDYFKGKLDRSTFQGLVDEHRTRLMSLGLDSGMIRLLRRFPADCKSDAERMLKALYDVGAVSRYHCDDEGYQSFYKEVQAKFTHFSDRTTSIFPEEARIAFELSSAVRPSRVVVAGSYYNYFAVWLVPGLANGGKIICADVDPVVCEMALKNMKALGVDDRVEVVCGDGEALLQNRREPIDLFVVDAYGSRHHPDPRYHGKSIYGPLIKAALPHLEKGAFVLAHNAEEGSKDLNEFYQALSGARFSLLLHTTDNAGVFWI